MNPFKSKEEKKQIKAERQERLTNEFLENKNLEGLNEVDKEFASKINDNLFDVMRYTIKGTQGEIAQLDMQSIIVEQNWLIIKLLNEINNKLDK